ncbi:transmembrane protein, partial [Thraustotheca clavata]
MFRATGYVDDTDRILSWHSPRTTTNNNDAFALKTPYDYKAPTEDNISKATYELEDGAIVGGGALSLVSREALTLFAHYLAIGIIYGMLPALQLPVFNNYLRMEGYQTSAYSVLIILGWTLKTFFGMLSDCFPIRGYRRKSYMLLGWTVAAICFGVMGFYPFPDPYCDAKAIKCPSKTPSVSNLTRDGLLKYYNFDAPDQGSLFIVLSVVASFGYVMAACAAGGMVVEYAQREPIATRGRTQTTLYVMKYFGTIFAQLIVAFTLNGKRYGGDFNFSISVSTMYLICFAPCVFLLFCTVLVLTEVKSEGVLLKEWAANFWDLLQTRVMWQVCWFKFIHGIFASFGATPSSPISKTWAGVTPLNDSLS